mmetsp:Transcript_31351/g.48950  ORF Transcript_31351/g.48950 Transcript_31351/m.48950 type:complete len:254 (-) Transcript_31351:1841-2602(-)
MCVCLLLLLILLLLVVFITLSITSTELETIGFEEFLSALLGNVIDIGQRWVEFVVTHFRLSMALLFRGLLGQLFVHLVQGVPVTLPVTLGTSKEETTIGAWNFDHTVAHLHRFLRNIAAASLLLSCFRQSAEEISGSFERSSDKTSSSLTNSLGQPCSSTFFESSLGFGDQTTNRSKTNMPSSGVSGLQTFCRTRRTRLPIAASITEPTMFLSVSIGIVNNSVGFIRQPHTAIRTKDGGGELGINVTAHVEDG